YLTSPPTEVLNDIVSGPFESEALPRGHFDPELTIGLRTEIVSAFAKQGAGGRINLAEVQIVCLRLWNSKDAVGEFARRGIPGLLEDFLADALSRIGAPLKPAALGLLTRLVTSSGTRNVVSEENLVTLAQKDRALGAQAYRVALNKLVETGIVRREQR